MRYKRIADLGRSGLQAFPTEPVSREPSRVRKAGGRKPREHGFSLSRVLETEIATPNVLWGLGFVVLCVLCFGTFMYGWGLVEMGLVFFFAILGLILLFDGPVDVNIVGVDLQGVDIIQNGSNECGECSRNYTKQDASAP